MGVRSMSNMKLWDRLKETDPKYTKPFSKFGGKQLTTVDPMYQIQMMTNMFGPVGKGWKYEVEYKYIDGLVFAEVKLKWFDKQWYEYGPVCSVQNLSKKNGGLDDEAPKKAMTDAMTKAFSHLGMSADVFLGMFDNSKYVETMKEKFNNKIPQKKSGPKHGSDTAHVNKDVQLIKDDILRCKSIYEYRDVKKDVEPYLETALKNKSPKLYAEISDLLETREDELNRRTNA